MKISRLEISNFRGIDSFEQDFINPLTNDPLDVVVFAGPNGSGKTSILESIVITLTRPKAKDDKIFSKQNERHGNDFGITLTIQNGRDKHVLSRSSSDSANPATTSHFLKMATTRVEYFSSWREPLLKGPLSATLGKKGNRPQDVEVNRLWNLKQFLINAFMSDKISQDEEIPGTQHLKAISKIMKALKNFYQGADFEIKIDKVSSNIEDGFDVFLKYPNSAGHFVALDNLSSGEIELFSFLSTIIRKDLADGILIVDEPELHLHVSWHRVILNALRDLLPNTQIICATHSIEIIESVKSYELFVLKSDEDYRYKEDLSR